MQDSCSDLAQETQISSPSQNVALALADTDPILAIKAEDQQAMHLEEHANEDAADGNTFITNMVAEPEQSPRFNPNPTDQTVLPNISKGSKLSNMATPMQNSNRLRGQVTTDTTASAK